MKCMIDLHRIFVTIFVFLNSRLYPFFSVCLSSEESVSSSIPAGEVALEQVAVLVADLVDLVGDQKPLQAEVCTTNLPRRKYNEG